MEFSNKMFNTTNVSRGDLITITFTKGTIRNGIVTEVKEDKISYTYFDSMLGSPEKSSVTVEQVLNHILSFSISKSLQGENIMVDITTKPTNTNKEKQSNENNNPDLTQILDLLKNMNGNNEDIKKIFGDKNPNDILETFFGSKGSPNPFESLFGKQNTTSNSEKQSQEKPIGFQTEKKEESNSTKSDNRSFGHFFNTLKNFKNIDMLLKAFKNEDSQTLAIIAHYLNPKSRVEFLYHLPENLLGAVQRNLNNLSHVNHDILENVEKQLSQKFEHFKKLYNQSQSETNENKKQSNSNPFDSFGGGLGGLFGGMNIEDAMKDIFGGSNSEDMPPMPNQEQMQEMVENMIENMPKMINDLFNPRNDDDDNNNF